MDKLYLKSIFEKYYLNGLIEKVKLKINDNKINITFTNEVKNLVGIIEAEDFEFKDCEIGIYDTTQFLKLISILNNFIILNTNENNGVIAKLLIGDDQYNLEYPLANVNIIPKPPKEINEPLTYDIQFKIDNEFILKFLKAYKALKVETLSIDTYYDENVPKVRFIIGEDSSFSNKIDFSVPAQIGIPGDLIKFPIEEIAQILDNNKDFTGKGYINPDGLFKLEFVETNNKIKSTYFLIGKE